MLIVQIAVLSFILFVVPALVGVLFAGERKETVGLPFFWVSGQILLWAGFLIISIPLILAEKSFSLLVTIFGIYTGVLTAGGVIRMARLVRGKKMCAGKNTPNGRSAVRILWLGFAVLLILQLVLTAFMAYEEGDDAFYVATATLTEGSDTMYRILPYTGMTTGLDARHGLAPFPVWVAYLARLSCMHAAVVSQIVLPLVLILMAYAIYYLIACQLFEKDTKKIPFFMIMTELLVIFGGYSVYSAENFLLVRASQGKAVIANIILPFLLYLMMLLLKKLQHQERANVFFWGLLASTMIAGCLCSTLGTMLTCMFLGIVGVCAVFAYRKWSVLVPMALCCVVPAGIAFLYFML